MKRLPRLAIVAIVLAAGMAHAQQATPEDFGVPQQQQQQPTQQPSQATTTQTATPAASSPAPTPEDEEKHHKIKPTFKVQLGYQYAQLHSVPINAGRLRTGVGIQNDVMAHYLTFASFIGATESERRVWDLRFGYEGELRLASIVRVGLGAEIGYVFVRRASIDERMWALGIGANFHVGVDAVSWGFRDDHALYIDARIEGHIHFGNADMWGPTLSVGLRF